MSSKNEIYNEIEHWNNLERKSPNACKSENEPQKTNHLNFIKSNLFNGCTVFEFGAGAGRILPSYEGIISFLFAYDISNKWKLQYIEKAKKFSFPFIHFVDQCLRDDVSELISGFDVVVTSLVLLHQRPSRINKVMNSLANIGKYVIVISKSSEKASINQKDTTSPNYDYNYMDICKKNNLYFSDPKYIDKQVYFCYSKEKLW